MHPKRVLIHRAQRVAWSPREIAEKLGVHKQTVYEAIKRHEITANKIGGRLVIPDSELQRLTT